MLDLLWVGFSSLFGLAFVASLMAFIYKRDAVDWEKLAAVYGRSWQSPRMQKHFTNMILYSDGRLGKSYKGVLTIGLYDNGIGLRPLIWLVPFQKPIFVPYSDIEGWSQRWYLDASATELSFRKTPDMRIIMPTGQVEWMLTFAEGRVPISPDRPPHGSWPLATFTIAIAMGAMATFLIAFLIYKWAA